VLMDNLVYTVYATDLFICSFAGEISGSHGDEYEDGCLLGCCAVHYGRS
jgi:hypothetical protein